MPTPHNLPAELTSFVGREPQLADLRRLLRKARLITLTGPGGSGKTRLSRRLVSGVLDRFPGGAWFVELGPVSDPGLLDRTVAAACGVREEKDRPIVDLLLMRLGGSPALLILDGAEHLVDACAKLAERLLRGSPGLTLVVTSREPLGVQGELVWRTPSLTMPKPDDAERPERLLKSEAVRLFIDRARLARPDFVLEASSFPQLAGVCVRLEGLPLAIELAATLVNAMTVQEIGVRLTDRHRLLTGGIRTAAPRYQALRHTIDWSYDLLTADERELFARLAVFAGGFDLESAEAVGSMEGEDVLATLLRLVNKSLVVAEARGSTTRYRMLDTIREYAVDKLGPSDAEVAHRSHAAHFLELSRQAARELRTGDQAAWLERIEEEMPNLRLALSWHEAESPDRLMQMTGYLSRYWYVRGKFTEGLDWLDRSLACPAEDAAARLSALQARARLRRHRGDYEGAGRDARECADVARRIGADQHLMGALTTLGNLSASLGEWEDAERAFSEALRLQERLGDPAMIASSLNNLALVESAQGDSERAQVLIGRALEAVMAVGDRILRASIFETAGRIERRGGDLAAARHHYLEALAIASEFEDIVNIADSLDGLALLALADRNPGRAVVLAGASSRQRLSSQSEPSRWDQNEVDRGVARARSMLPAAAAAQAWKRGVTMKLEDVVSYARGDAVEKRANGGPTLTAREMQVATLIAEGLTNGEIAGRLKMAERTADAHVEHIRNKLGLHTRSQIAVWAHDHMA